MLRLQHITQDLKSRATIKIDKVDGRGLGWIRLCRMNGICIYFVYHLFIEKLH